MVGFLVSILVVAVPTALAVAPMRGSWTRGQISWRLGMQINELPFVGAAWVAVNTALAAWQGNLTTPVERATAALAVLTLAGLALIGLRGLRARSAVLAALAAGLGATPPARPRGLATWCGIVLTPLRVARRDVVHRRNLAYGPAGRENLLDTYRPRGRETDGHCLVYFHGGGYRSGAKNREARALLYRLASDGWFCVSANYRLRGARWPDQLQDAHRAVAWTRTAAVDAADAPPRIFVAGSSAGAHLAATTALTSPGSFGLDDVRLAGAVCLYGFYDTPPWIDRDPSAASSPIDLVEPGAVPFFIAHGSLDSFVSPDGARAFAQRLREVSHQPVVYAELPGGQHTFDLYHSMRFDAVVEGIAAFTARVRSSDRNQPRRIDETGP
jgi:acetyl esterase/lipase